MSVLIKGREMPKNCGECAIERCNRWQKLIVAGMSIAKSRPKDCPLIEIPPHGRLIDADALMKEFEKAENAFEQHGREFAFSFMSSGQEISTEWYAVELMLEDAPTIIEAEVDDDQRRPH